ncbi:uncharacterized protein PRCAT00005727001 [Priceomyces carsonii]|uniref:uncharacterized protein n=1 Tax=Priceomyces carsonii TaxID=28549 RepID=UPI002ED9DF7D|nr:unnamed protein product [Priceomyces carsonii]
MSGFFHKYNQLLKAHPFKTNMVGTSLFFSTGDIIAQLSFPPRSHDIKNQDLSESVKSRSGFDYKRTLRGAVYGAFVFAPCAVTWYGRRLPKIKNPFIRKHRDTWSQKKLHVYDTLFRVTLDQLFVPGFIWIPMYVTSMSILSLNEHPLDVARENLRNNWWHVLKANWIVWPAFQLVNMYLIPVHIRVVCANLWSVGWNCFISYVGNSRRVSNKVLEEVTTVEDPESVAYV